jgi:membrane protein implicated in regulation of membrane protease activity
MKPIIILVAIIPVIAIIVLLIMGMPLKFLFFLFLASCLFIAVFLWFYSRKMDRESRELKNDLVKKEEP